MRVLARSCALTRTAGSVVYCAAGQSDDLEQRPPFADLVDLGIARSTMQMTAWTDTSSPTIGTMAYMSPERINGDVGDRPDALESTARGAVRPVRGTLEARDPASTAGLEQVEHDLRTAVDGLNAFGALPAAARTRLVLADWLRAAGRVDEADAAVAEAGRSFVDVGAQAWLRETEPVPLRRAE